MASNSARGSAGRPAPEVGAAPKCKEGMVCSDKDRTGHPGAAPVYAYMHSECPVNRRELGRASWAFLHTLAAYYPVEPSVSEQDRMRRFILDFSAVYPCGYCSDTTSDEMRRNPPKVGSRAEFSEYICDIHNEVNDRLGKPAFDCSKVPSTKKSNEITNRSCK